MLALREMADGPGACLSEVRVHHATGELEGEWAVPWACRVAGEDARGVAQLLPDGEGELRMETFIASGPLGTVRAGSVLWPVHLTMRGGRTLTVCLSTSARLGCGEVG